MYISDEEIRQLKINALAMKEFADTLLNQIGKLEKKMILDESSCKRKSTKKKDVYDEFKAKAIALGARQRLRKENN